MREYLREGIENKEHMTRTLVHLGVLQHVCREYDRQNPKNEKAKQILSAFSGKEFIIAMFCLLAVLIYHCLR